MQIANGLNFLHDHSVIHNDLTLGNILIDKNFHFKIIDFGGSTIIEGKKLVGDVQENIYYKPKERVELNKDPEPSHDIYSYGVCLFTAINGYEDTRYFYQSCEDNVAHKFYEKVTIKYNKLRYKNEKNGDQVFEEDNEKNVLQARILYKLYETFSKCCLSDKSKRSDAKELSENFENFINTVVTRERLSEMISYIEKLFSMKNFKFNYNWVDIIETVSSKL